VDDDLSFADLEDRTELLMQAISKAADKAIPKRKIRTKQIPLWWTRELNEQRKNMKTAYKINTNPEERQRYRREYNSERNSFVKLLRKEKNPRGGNSQGKYGMINGADASDGSKRALRTTKLHQS